MLKFKINKNRIDENTIKYQIVKPNNEILNYEEFLNLLKAGDKEFSRFFRDEIKSIPSDLSPSLSAYFWECIPVSRNTLNRKFEFVAIKSSALNNIHQDYSNFQEHFRKSNDGQAVSFSSFSGDTLIVPTPKSGADYKNITKFTDNTSIGQWEALWQKVGEKMEENLINAGGSTRWLSTSGLAVHYLHVRIDKRPKYYNHQEYLTETQQQQEIPPKNW